MPEARGQLAVDLREEGKTGDAGEVLKTVVELDPANVDSRARLARIYLATGNLSAAREYLTAEVAGDDPAMLLAVAELAEADLDSGQMSEATLIAEDLAVREPSTQAHLDRYRPALVASADPDPDAEIAERCRTAAGDGGASDGRDELGADFFDEPGPTAPTARASTHDGEAADRLAAVNMSADAWVRAPAVEAESGVDLSSFFGEDFAPAAVRPVPAPTEPEAAPVVARAAPAGGALTGESMEIDLTSVLGDLEGAGATGEPSPPAPAMDRPAVPAGMLPAQSLDVVFDKIRDEVVSDASVEEAAAQQYQLGLSYRQMGKLDEAIGPLETAARSTRYRFNSVVMLGRLYFDKQEPARALDLLERATEAPAPSDDDHHALLYHLGVTLERIGETV